MICPPNSFKSVLEREANIVGTCCTVCGTANSLTILPYLGACKSWWVFVTNLGSQCLCDCPDLGVSVVSWCCNRECNIFV